MSHSDYKKVREIGSGSFGRAYLVQAGQQYRVLKEVDMAKMGQQERASAEGEVKVLSKLKHPYIVRYWESYVHNSKLCIVMDYCDGGDLFKYIERRRQQRANIPEQQVLRWFTQICLALKYMHDEKHTLHRDIKPQNVFLMPKEGGPLGSVKLADFGISKVLGGGCAVARTQCGTPYYLSPEMCQQKPYGSGCDVWAMGCVLYQLCTQKVPFDAQSIQALMDRISRGPLPPAPAGYSREVGALIAEILERNATRRPTCAAILQKTRMQQEIQAMYVENKKGREEQQGSGDNREQRVHEHQAAQHGPADGRGDRAAQQALADARCARSPSPMRELPARARSPSPAKRLGVREPSPHRSAAKEVLCPSRAASPRGHQGGCLRSPSPARGFPAPRGGA